MSIGIGSVHTFLMEVLVPRQGKPGVFGVGCSTKLVLKKFPNSLDS